MSGYRVISEAPVVRFCRLLASIRVWLRANESAPWLSRRIPPAAASILELMRPCASIPFRRETEIGEPALGACHSKNLPHLLVGQCEVENVDVFRQPFDFRGSRYCRNVLLHQPAQADLRCG